jgi:hypothetical protein
LLVGGLGLGLFALAFAVKAGGLTCFDVLVVGMATALALGRWHPLGDGGNRQRRPLACGLVTR